MSKLETNTIDTVSGTSNLTIGGANNTGSTTIKTNNTDAVTIDNSQNLKFNSGYGSVATAYGCRAWVNFNGTGTVAIRDSGNVSSISDLGVGDYQVNFTTAMPDSNYSVNITRTWAGICGVIDSYSTTNCRLITGYVTNFSGSASGVDVSLFNVSVFR